MLKYRSYKVFSILLIIVFSNCSGNKKESYNRGEQVLSPVTKTCNEYTSPERLYDVGFDLEANSAELITKDQYGTEFKSVVYINYRFILKDKKLLVYNNGKVFINKNVDSFFKKTTTTYTSCMKSEKYHLIVKEGNDLILEIHSSVNIIDSFSRSRQYSSLIFYLNKNKRFEIDFNSIYGEVTSRDYDSNIEYINGGRGSITDEYLKKMFDN